MRRQSPWRGRKSRRRIKFLPWGVPIDAKLKAIRRKFLFDQWNYDIEEAERDAANVKFDSIEFVSVNGNITRYNFFATRQKTFVSRPNRPMKSKVPTMSK
jgi:hypothetical protein